MKNTSRLSMSAFEFATPVRPVPKFVQEPSFSQKKHYGATPRDSQPPRLPAKSLPSVSRLFPLKSRNEEHEARNVSFRQSENSAVLQSPHYNQSSGELYFDQCFTIERRLGAGSFGEVFKVQSKEDGGHYAVKRSRDRFKGHSDKRRKLEEVKKHESLSKHPNCVEFHRAWAERGHLYIQTELCKMSLQAYAEQNHNIPERVLWSFLVDLIKGLNHMHSNGLLHLDVKPENVLVSYDGVCKLGDFGLSVEIRENEFLEAQEGDPKYLAPELLQGQFGKHADVFSLGITILELASDLELPRNGDSWHDLREGRIPWQLTAGISPALQQIIKDMMAPDFRNRPSLAGLLETPVIQRTIAWQRCTRLVQRTWGRIIGFLFVIYSFMSCLLLRIIPSSSQGNHGNRIKDERDGASIKHIRHPSEWDLSFSDDEIFESDVSHGSLGYPLGSISFSSEEEHSRDLHSKSSNRSFQVPVTPKLIKSCRGPTPRSSSPITTGQPFLRRSPRNSPNISLVKGNMRTLTPSRTPRCTPRCTPSRLDFSSGESDSERPSMVIEPRSLSLEFEALDDD